MLQQPEVLQQRVAKLCKCRTQVTGTFSHALLIWKATSLIQTTACCKLQHIAAYLQHIYWQWVRIEKSMPNLGYQRIFTLSIDLEGSPLDPSNGMLQIAAYLQHICCKWRFLKNYEFSKDDTQGIVSLESNYTSQQISRCCSNQKCCYNMLQQLEVLQQWVAKWRNVKLRLLVQFYTLF